MVVYVLYMVYSGMGVHPLGVVLAEVDVAVQEHLLFLYHLLLSLVFDALVKLLRACSVVFWREEEKDINIKLEEEKDINIRPMALK